MKPRACRIVCTLGPATDDPAVLAGIVRAGMNVARLNFSHGTDESHRERLRQVRAISADERTEVAILQDLQGHKVRVGKVTDDGHVTLTPGQMIRVGYGTEVDADRVGIDYEGIADQVSPGDPIYIDDGLIELTVRERSGEDFICEVVVGTELKSRKGVIFPSVDLEFPLINDRDLEDARFGVEIGVDMVAMSFVRGATEVNELRCKLLEWGNPNPFIVSKIEDRLGVKNLDQILEVSDAVLVARGDMGVTLPREVVPGIQRKILLRANAMGVPVITATQMLESMIQCHRPTRAEVSDVHNAVLDGTDAVMLSGETATGAYPVEAVEEMDRICRGAELHELRERVSVTEGREGMYDRVAASAGSLAKDVGAKFVLGFSASGATLRALSAARCAMPVYGVVESVDVLRRLLLHRGVHPQSFEAGRPLVQLFEPVLQDLIQRNEMTTGDKVILVAGKMGPESKSHLLKVYEVD